MDVSYVAAQAQQYVPGCPAITVERMVNEVLIEFCRQTHIWREELAPVYLPADETTVELVKSETQQILAVTRLEVDGEPVTAYTARPPRQIELDNAYTEATTVVGWAILAPAVGCPNVPVVVEPWLDTIVDGVIARLATIHGQPWASADTYAFRQVRYARGIHEARISINRKGRNAVLNVAPVRI